ncbi:uncharacterized protein [Lepeophtheirus salmonis]|uniref:uncharacterized protein n=1 Tax=Lepeophtheirus salmonis TaxID=72036 RepID=UPI001AEB268C|nr:uncharacterized protein LOC121125362 [Lepeophtheirus salmonis]
MENNNRHPATSETINSHFKDKSNINIDMIGGEPPEASPQMMRERSVHPGKFGYVAKEIEASRLLNYGAINRNLCSTLISFIFIGLGVSGIIIGNVYKDKCTLMSIDYYAIHEGRMSNIPRWFIVAGIAFTILGIIGSMTVGACPLMIRARMPICGNFVANRLTGSCFVFFFFLCFIVVVIINIMGTLWLYVSSLDPVGYDTRLDKCAPFIWYSAHIITKGFWIISAIGAISLGAKFYAFTKGDDIITSRRYIQSFK